MNPFHFVALTTVILALSSTASFAADDGPVAEATVEAQPVDDNVQHKFSLTFSPFHLAVPLVYGTSTTPFFELTGEFRAGDKTGIALTLGAGQVAGLFLGEVQGQARYYLLGSFIHGLSLGLEAGYSTVHGSVTTSPGTTVTGGGQGFSVSPLLGYKIATNLGFTFDIQAGPALVFASAVASTNGTVERASVGPVLTPNVNINLGWSF